MSALRWVLLLCTLVWRTEAVFNRPYEIKLQNNEYTDVLVAINNEIPEDPRIVDRLKEILTEASQELYVATNNRAFLKQVKILIPRTWTKKPEYLPAGTETFERANVRVDNANPLNGDNPYVQQKGGCREGGDYMHLTPSYIVDKEYGEDNWGPNGKTFVHEWGHLRWGLFEEYGFESPSGGSYPRYYSTSAGGVQPTRCSAHVAGYSVNKVTDCGCDPVPETGIPEPGCRFYPDDNSNEATGSYMFMHFLSQVTSFCHSDPAGDPLSYHNREAPNKHNALCQLKSAWDVMSEHQDFANGANPPRNVASTVPDFALLQDSDYRIVLVLDTSGSMDGDPIRHLNQVVTRFIRSTVSDGSYVGVVTFSNYARLRHRVVSVSSDAVREALVAAVPNRADGGTCIGCGLRKGVEALEDVGQPEGGVLFLVTDGLQTDPPNIADMMPELLRKRVIVNTIAYSRDADGELESLALQTGGLSFFARLNDSTALDNAFTATFETTAGGKGSGVTLLSEDKTVGAGETYTNDLYIDNSVGVNTTFSFSWLAGPPPKIFLGIPLGTDIAEGSPEYHVDTTADTITFRILETATPGKWIYNMTNVGHSDQTIATIVTSNPLTDEEPIRVTAQVSTVSLNYSSSEPTALTIFATVRKGYLPVTGAVVKVYIEKPPDGQVEELMLLDNGAGADITKNDGIYSRYFYDFSANGRYGVSVKADNSQGNAGYIDIQGGSGSGAPPLDPDTGYTNYQQKPLDQFQRITTGGVFDVSGVPSGGVPTRDMLPPSRVDDLAVREVSYKSATVRLAWTALGDDFDQGGPAHYVDIRYGRHFDQLADDFHGSSAVNHSQVLLGSLTSPPLPGSVQTIVILVPDRGNNVTFVFSLRMCDEEHNCGQPSNIVSANLEYIPESDCGDNTMTWVIVGCVAGGAVLVTTTVAVLYIQVSNDKKPCCSTEGNKSPTVELDDITSSTAELDRDNQMVKVVCCQCHINL